MYSSGSTRTSPQITTFDAFALRTCATTSSCIRGAVIAPPPPYAVASTMNTSLVPPPPYSATTRDIDIDVVGIINEARGVRLSDDDDEESNEKPLDLSVKKSPTSCAASCSSPPSFTQSRPSVIRNGYGDRHTDMRRSASSVTSRPTPEPDVSEHFRRSLSGKWPRRQVNHAAHYTPLQSLTNNRKGVQCLPMSARRSPPSGASPPQHIVVNNSGIEIEDHFRKALGAEAYELLRKSRQTNLT
uniref:Uncharacterized protein n=1 Tax=Parascaris univalens TaxID=6257 RepID=A0A914ZIH9_PARUN